MGPVCGNGMCEMGEDSMNCAMDCGMACAGVVPAAGNLVVNEIHTAPLSSIDDVNCDGAMGSSEEFIELVNTTNTTLDLQNVDVSIGGTSRLQITQCMGTYEAIVIYRSA